MNSVLNELLSIGFFDRLDGDDGRVAKLEKAASTVAADLKASPRLLISAVLAGIDPEVPASDPLIGRAEQALISEWRSLSSVFPDKPINWYRAILLEACANAATGKSAAVLWLTAVDHLPQLRLGREEGALRGLVWRWAETCEKEATRVDAVASVKKPGAVKLATTGIGPLPSPRAVDRTSLTARVAAAAGQNYRGNAVANPNPYWTNSAQHWSWDFADRMGAVLSDELEAVGAESSNRFSEGLQQIQSSVASTVSEVQAALEAQRTWMDSTMKAASSQRVLESLQVEALWWSQAMYSGSLRRGYRELPATLAAFVMAMDLLELVSNPAPASVGYLLAESVAKLSGASYERRYKLSSVLQDVREARRVLPGSIGTLDALPSTGCRLSLRDLLTLASSDRDALPSADMTRSAFREDPELSLPTLAHAFFRQEQAVLIAGAMK